MILSIGLVKNASQFLERAENLGNFRRKDTHCAKPIQFRRWDWDEGNRTDL